MKKFLILAGVALFATLLSCVAHAEEPTRLTALTQFRAGVTDCPTRLTPACEATMAEAITLMERVREREREACPASGAVEQACENQDARNALALASMRNARAAMRKRDGLAAH